MQSTLHGFAEGMRCRARAITEDPRRRPPQWLPPETLAAALANHRRPGKVGEKGIGKRGLTGWVPGVGRRMWLAGRSCASGRVWVGGLG
jgi:hypothetical protein